METTKALVIANAKRVIEILEKDKISSHTELTIKMKELRRDTIRLDHILHDRLTTCANCGAEVLKKDYYGGKCGNCRWRDHLDGFN